MCLIALQLPQRTPLNKDQMRTAWKGNSDGAGYMFAHRGKLVVRKPFWKFKRLWQCYQQDHARFGAEAAFVLHFRYATHGSHCASNVHPHIIHPDQTACAHNGIFDLVESHKSKSDTVLFVEQFLRDLTPAALLSARMKDTLEECVGANKLAILDRSGAFSIVGEKLGHWDGETWYSNYGYISQPAWSGLNYWHGLDGDSDYQTSALEDELAELDREQEALSLLQTGRSRIGVYRKW